MSCWSDAFEERANETLAMIEDEGGEASVFAADVTSDDDCRALVEATVQRYGRLDILDNNVGIPKRQTVVEVSEADWDDVMAVNVKSIMLASKYAIPEMVRGGGGSIINTASFVALLGAATPQLAYTASKGGVLALTRELAVVHAREGIRVNALCPGPLRTELLMKYLDTDEKRQRRLVHIPMGRFGEADEIANAALYLASDESSFVTGQLLAVSGGMAVSL